MFDWSPDREGEIRSALCRYCQSRRGRRLIEGLPFALHDDAVDEVYAALAMNANGARLLAEVPSGEELQRLVNRQAGMYLSNMCRTQARFNRIRQNLDKKYQPAVRHNGKQFTRMPRSPPFLQDADALLRHLTPDEQEIVQLRAIGLSIREVAEVVGVSDRTIARRFDSLRTRLRTLAERN